MNFCTVKETAERWGVSERFVRKLCKEGRIENVVRDEDTWLIPSGIEKPGRKKYEKKPPLDVDLSDYAKRIVRQRIKNNHYGIYEYIQLNLAPVQTAGGESSILHDTGGIAIYGISQTGAEGSTVIFRHRSTSLHFLLL